ncbi:MAG: hypothetical protein AB1801_20515, partial [Chloroflexota bacterium]
MKRKFFLITFVALLSLALAACAAAPTAAPEATEAPAAAPEATEAPTEAPAAMPEATEAPAAEVRDFVTWYQYDQNNEDPASDERVGNEYLRKTIPLFNEAFAGKWNWVNQPKAFDRMATELVAAVQAGGDVPDLFEGQSNMLNTFYQNGTLQDLTEWAEAQPWFADLDPNAVISCQGPDGKL